MELDEQKKIYRSRQPITHDGKTGYIDFWTSNESKARVEAEQSPDRIFEALTLSDIDKFNPNQRLKALAAFESCYSKGL